MNIQEGDDLTAVEIDMLYQQRMTVEIPVRDVPPTPESAFRLVKNTDPEFVADVIPNRWDDLTATGELNVVDVREASSTGGDEP
jgi:hypothetical protein